jgi:hypothetical protein
LSGAIRPDPVRAVIPVYSVSIAAVVRFRALADPAYLADYLRQVQESGAPVCACDHVGLDFGRVTRTLVLSAPAIGCALVLAPPIAGLHPRPLVRTRLRWLLRIAT